MTETGTRFRKVLDEKLGYGISEFFPVSGQR